jgi:hypothetical protein
MTPSGFKAVTVRHLEDSNVLDDSLKIPAQLSNVLTVYTLFFSILLNHISFFLNETMPILADSMSYSLSDLRLGLTK